MADDQDILWRDVADLCIGKPPVRLFPATATVADALRALKSSDETCLSVWNTDGKSCVGKVCMADIICYICSGDNIACPADALKAPLSAILSPPSSFTTATVGVVHPNSSVLQALDMMLEGPQSLVVPILDSGVERKDPVGAGAPAVYCWLCLEDFVRYFLNSIAHFSPLPSLSIADLNLIRPAAAVLHRDAALSTVPLLRAAAADHSSVAVIDDFGCLVGDICPSAFSYCNETAAAAVAALTAGELASYMDCFFRNSSLISLLRSRLRGKNLERMVELLVEDSPPPSSSASPSSSTFESSGSSSSSDEESTAQQERRRLSRRRSGSFCHAEGSTVCSPRSSLMAVMLQAVAHRTSYVWVVPGGNENKLAGVIVLDDILRVFRDSLVRR